ncbi:MAG TPA: amidophosphoribosyltransferase [Candidatus Paceibacterota bacterium]|nr:amidophosphoribosyltransferase [Verrucomicrobiota bacterium]HRZ46120.1 amidophosphoribosyltransferase [Candidatus Paceibacterota bacterium]
MGGFFGVASKADCVEDLFYGTDYHSHLGTQRGGLAVRNAQGIARVIHDIRNAQFRSKFADDIVQMSGSIGVGVISDFEDQPLLIRGRRSLFAIVTVGAVRNTAALAEKMFRRRGVHFAEMSHGDINPTEIVAALINQEETFADGIRHAQEEIEGSCSLLLLTDEGIYAARDRRGRTPVILAQKEGSCAVTFETCALSNLDYEFVRDLGPGEVVLVTPEGFTTLKPPLPEMKMCSFLWVYYGYPASTYEGRNVECVRYACGRCLARRDSASVDVVCGIPDSGIGHALGYASEAGLPYRRPFVKYTPTWPRSFMPQNQKTRDLVARMKLIPVREIIDGQRLLFCEDSIVRGTQLKDTIQRLFRAGAREVHMRPACPPLMFGCPYLNFSRSRTELDLAARRAIQQIDGEGADLEKYTDPAGAPYQRMCRQIGGDLGLTSLHYQRLDDLLGAIGLPAGHACTFCWNGQA